jgi:signal transduction histidine kinase
VELNLSLIDYNGYKAVLASSRNIQQKLDAERREEEHRKNLLWLSRAALDFLEMSELEEIYQYIGKNLSRLIPQSVSIISDINEKEDVITPKYIIGLNNNIYKKIMSLLGVNPIGKSYQFVDDLKKIYSKQNLVAFKGGLKEFSYGYVNEGITREIEQLLNLKKIYTIGLQRNQKLFSAIHIFKFKTEAITHFNTVEAFLNQASIALQRKMLENELIKAKEKAEESEKLKTAFLANLSHEIRTPLNIILGYVQMLNNPNLAEEFRKQYIDAIHSSSDHLIEIINDVLSMAKLDTGQQNLQTSKFSLNKALLEIYSSFEAKAARKRIRFDCYTPLQDDECIICSDENKIRQVISNLLNNALKFTPEKGMVSFGYSIKKNRVNLFVKDNGIGIPENYLEKIFERFTQVEDSNNRSFEGTGLGLPISRGLVELLGGTIQVKSNLRKGTTFFVNLPLNCSSPEKPSDIKSV